MEAPNLSPEITDQDRILLVFAYLGPLALVSLVVSRRELVKWHAKQGALLGATVVAAYLVLKPLHLFLLNNRYLWWLGELFWAAVGLAALGMLVLLLLCIVRALEGERFKVPVLGDLADRI